MICSPTVPMPLPNPVSSAEKVPLEGDGEGVEPDGNRGEEADGQEALQDVQGGVLDIGPPAGILDAALENAHHQAHAEQGPPQLGEEQDDGLDPVQLKQLHPHVAHLREEVAQESHHLAVKPVDELVHNGGGYKVKDKQG